MPDPPDVNLFTRFILENPLPTVAFLAILAIGATWIGLQRGQRNPLLVAGALAIAAGAVFATGTIVVTPGEHGERITRELVDRVVAGEHQRAFELFDENVTFAIGSPRNPGYDRGFIERQINRLDGGLAITSNRITRLRGYTEDSDTAIVHLACRTEVARGYAPTPSEWVVEVRRQEDGEWRITRMTIVSLQGRTPSDRLW